MKMETIWKANGILDNMRILEAVIKKWEKDDIEKLRKDNPGLLGVSSEAIHEIKELVLSDANKQLMKLNKDLDAL